MNHLPSALGPVAVEIVVASHDGPRLLHGRHRAGAAVAHGGGG